MSPHTSLHLWILVKNIPWQAGLCLYVSYCNPTTSLMRPELCLNVKILTRGKLCVWPFLISNGKYLILKCSISQYTCHSIASNMFPYSCKFMYTFKFIVRMVKYLFIDKWKCFVPLYCHKKWRTKSSWLKYPKSYYLYIKFSQWFRSRGINIFGTTAKKLVNQVCVSYLLMFFRWINQ